ncbi:1-pyrroline-5-carboxylate dehydrogenase, partial [Saccharopolyspora kobensis]
MDAITSVPVPYNEPVKGYAPGSPERESLQKRVAELESEQVELTQTIGGVQRLAGGDRFDVVQPHDHAHVLGTAARTTFSSRA